MEVDTINNIEKQNVRNWKNVIRLGVALFAFLTLVITVILKLLLDVAVIRIVPTEQCNVASAGINICISSIIKNNSKAYDLNQIIPTGWFLNEDGSIENTGNSNYPLEIRTRRYDSLQITFAINPYMGMIDIETANQKYELDLYSSDESGTFSTDVPFAVMEEAPLAECVVLGLILAVVITGGICYLLYFASPGIKSIGLFSLGCMAAVLFLRSGVGYGEITNVCFIVAYGYFSEKAILSFFNKHGNKTIGVDVFFVLISAYASVATLYKYLIKPYSSFHFGIYGTAQFILVFFFWLFCFSVVIGTLEHWLIAKEKTDTPRGTKMTETDLQTEEIR